MRDISEIEREMKGHQKESFRRFMEQQSTRMMISLIPATEKAEFLETLLLSAFEAGFGSGSAVTSIHIMESVLKRRGQID